MNSPCCDRNPVSHMIKKAKTKKAAARVVLVAAAPAQPSSARPRRRRNRATSAAAAAYSTPSAPAALGVSRSAQPRNVVKTFTRDSEVISFCELLAPTIGTGNVGTTVVFNSPLGMQALVGTRLAVMAQLWEKFRFRSLRLRVVSSVPTSVGGNGIIAWDADPVDLSPINTPQGMQSLTAQENAMIFSFWEGCVLPCNLGSLPDSGFYTNAGQTSAISSDPRLYQQGQIFVATLNPPTSPVTISLMIEGEIEFFARNMQFAVTPTEVSNSSPALLLTSFTSTPVWNALQPLIAGTGNLNIIQNGLRLALPFVQPDGTSVGLNIPSGIYEILFGASNVQTPVSGTTVQARTQDPPAVRSPSSVSLDSSFDTNVTGSTTTPKNVFLKWRLDVPDPAGTNFQVGIGPSGGTSGWIEALPALQITRLFS